MGLLYIGSISLITFLLCRKVYQLPIQFYLKMVIFTSIGYILSYIVLPLILIRPRDYRIARFPAWCTKSLIRWFGLKFQVRGIENIDKSKGGVVLLNHQCFLDLVVLSYLWSILGNPVVVAKKEMLFIYPASYFWGTLYIDRENSESAIRSLKLQVKAIEENSQKLVIFPEGTRNTSDTLLPFKKGAFHVAVESQSFIQPIVTSRFTYYDLKNKIFSKGHSVISILPAIDCKGLTTNDIPSLMEKTQTLMQAELTLLTEETSNYNLESEISMK